jgi:uncharacterized protein YjbJ (UPF0337 family)
MTEKKEQMVGEGEIQESFGKAKPEQMVGEGEIQESFGKAKPEQMVSEGEIQESFGKAKPEQMIKIKLLGQGSHGCIYDREVKCNSTIGDPLFVTKIQLQSENIERELSITKLIREIPFYERY